MELTYLDEETSPSRLRERPSRLYKIRGAVPRFIPPRAASIRLTGRSPLPPRSRPRARARKAEKIISAGQCQSTPSRRFLANLRSGSRLDLATRARTDLFIYLFTVGLIPFATPSKLPVVAPSPAKSLKTPADRSAIFLPLLDAA